MAPEERDDDNTISGDGCSAECTLELDAVCSVRVEAPPRRAS
ncbi:hypothetical protein [Sorangium sp. So ce1151]